MLAVFLVRFQKMISLFSSLRSCTLILFITVLSLRTSNGEDHKHEICSSSLISCGKLHNVSYPFWGLGRPKYCGHPVLQLECPTFPNHDGYPFLKIGEVYYEILSIDNNNNTLPIINIQLREFNKSIGYPHHISIKDFDTIFHYSESVEKITLHVCCGEEIEEIPSWFKTNTNWGNDCLAYYYPEKISSTNKFQGCHRLEVPVIKDWEILLHRNESVTLFEVLQQGFKVDYLNSLACSKCKNSSGTCGSNDEGFACFQRKPDWKLIVGIAVAATIIGILIVLVLCIRKRRSSKKFSILWKLKGKKYQNIDAFLKVYGSLAPKRYTYAMIRKITNGFSEKLGEGGYAMVYKGKLCNERVVAVKLLKQSKGSGEDFINEVASISRTNHVNIVALLGFCFEGSKRALIYEYMSNGSLEKFAYQGARERALPLETLFDIGVGIATGLDYLHRGCNARILHFDIKPHNILLDEEFRPKISDFGLARLCPQQESSISTMETARGTIGYIAPEVFCRTFGGVSHKSDVYSYGMMILDIVCGRKNMVSVEIQHSSEMYFPQWIYKRLQHGDGEEDAAHGIMTDEQISLERKMILVSLWCIQTYPSNRPSMTQVIEMLQGDVELLPMPPEPNLSSPPRSAYNSSDSTQLMTNDNLSL